MTSKTGRKNRFSPDMTESRYFDFAFAPHLRPSAVSLVSTACLRLRRRGKAGNRRAAVRSRPEAGNHLPAVPAVDVEIRVSGEHDGVGQRFAQAHQAGVGQTHGDIGGRNSQPLPKHPWHFTEQKRVAAMVGAGTMSGRPAVSSGMGGPVKHTTDAIYAIIRTHTGFTDSRAGRSGRRARRRRPGCAGGGRQPGPDVFSAKLRRLPHDHPRTRQFGDLKQNPQLVGMVGRRAGTA